MKKLAREDVYNLWLDTPFADRNFLPKSRDDFGGPNSVRLHLRKDKDFHFLKDNDFGTYLGYHENVGGYVVAIKTLSNDLSGGEVYESLEELKRVWVLD